MHAIFGCKFALVTIPCACASYQRAYHRGAIKTLVYITDIHNALVLHIPVYTLIHLAALEMCIAYKKMQIALLNLSCFLPNFLHRPMLLAKVDQMVRHKFGCHHTIMSLLRILTRKHTFLHWSSFRILTFSNTHSAQWHQSNSNVLEFQICCHLYGIFVLKLYSLL